MKKINEEDKFGFVYIWFDRKRKMYYIGSHWGTENDGYICSSHRMRNAYRYRPETFKPKRIIAKIYTSRSDLFNEEQRWLDMIPDDQLGKKYYNLNKYVVSNHWSMYENMRLNVAQKISRANKGKSPPNKGKTNIEFHGAEKAAIIKQKASEASKGRPSHNKGKKASQETIERLRHANLGTHHTEETKVKISNSMQGEKNHFYNKKHTEETKILISQKRLGVKQTEEQKLKNSLGQLGVPKSESHKENIRKCKIGLFWWNNGTINKHSKTCPGEGWVKGHLKKITQKRIMTEEEKLHLKQITSNSRWYTNGEKNIRLQLNKEPPLGFSLGKVKKI